MFNEALLNISKFRKPVKCVQNTYDSIKHLGCWSEALLLAHNKGIDLVFGGRERVWRGVMRLVRAGGKVHACVEKNRRCFHATPHFAQRKRLYVVWGLGVDVYWVAGVCASLGASI